MTNKNYPVCDFRGMLFGPFDESLEICKNNRDDAWLQASLTFLKERYGSVEDCFYGNMKVACNRKHAYSTRRKYFESAVLLYYLSETLQNEIEYLPSATAYQDRFKRRSDPPLGFYPDGIDYTTPEFNSGLYFIGSTRYNPYTRETIFLVKIGKTGNFKSRFGNYTSEHPLLWRIDYFGWDDPDTLGAMEKDFHRLLEQFALAKIKGTSEWYMVSEKTYLAMCEQGFRFFKDK